MRLFIFILNFGSYLKVLILCLLGLISMIDYDQYLALRQTQAVIGWKLKDLQSHIMSCSRRIKYYWIQYNLSSGQSA